MYANILVAVDGSEASKYAVSEAIRIAKLSGGKLTAVHVLDQSAAFTMSLALEVAKHGVTVNTVSPGYLATAMTAAIPNDVMDARILPQIPVGRLGQPDEIAALVSFLCSDDAGLITGADFAINGGMHMR
jgi:nucleotide-binding universal stress UspA family protein